MTYCPTDIKHGVIFSRGNTAVNWVSGDLVNFVGSVCRTFRVDFHLNSCGIYSLV